MSRATVALRPFQAAGNMRIPCRRWAHTASVTAATLPTAGSHANVGKSHGQQQQCTLRPRGVTHEVENQTDIFRSMNNYETDACLMEIVEKLVPSADDRAHVSRVGAYAGSAETLELAQSANANRPQLMQFDRNGRRVDVVCDGFYVIIACDLATRSCVSRLTVPDRHQRAKSVVCTIRRISDARLHLHGRAVFNPGAPVHIFLLSTVQSPHQHPL